MKLPPPIEGELLRNFGIAIVVAGLILLSGDLDLFEALFGLAETDCWFKVML